jgi:hypothetical protein
MTLCEDLSPLVTMSAPSLYPTLAAGMEAALSYANQALRREMAIHKALGVPWVVWDDEKQAVRWIPPEELPDLPPEDRPVLPESSAPPPLGTRP